MASITSHYETLGTLRVEAGQTVTIGWELFIGEFPPLINHRPVRGPVDLTIQVRTMEQRTKAAPADQSFFRYTVHNPSSRYLYVGYNYIFFKVS